MKYLTAILSGTLFGAGLGISGMMNTEKVKGFLDITGNWDPSLALVMGGALLVTLITYPFVTKRANPICEKDFSLPTQTSITKEILIGPALFGIGWGLIGLCPGPAIANLMNGGAAIIVFTIIMILSMVITDKVSN